MSIKSGMPSSHLILCCPFLLMPSMFPNIRVFSNESVLCISWPKYWSFRISLSNEYPGLISFRMDWLDLLAVQGTLKSLLQHYSSKASILRRSAFFMVQLLHPYVTTGKTIALTRRTFVSKVMSLLFNMLSRWAAVYGVAQSWTRLKRLSSISSSQVAQRLKCLPLMWRPGFNPWVGKIPWRRKWQPTPVFLPGESHGWRSLVGYSPWGPKESDTNE